MKKRHFLIFLAAIALSLTQCELFLGEREHTNVTIDLGEVFGTGSGRAIGLLPPEYANWISPTSIRVSVFGDGMQPMQKTVSPGTRYINLYVPAGRDRHFTLEVFFEITNPIDYPFPHLRSYKGRASADLRPGSAVKLVFRMGAGATELLVPDKNRETIFWADDISDFLEDNQSAMGSDLYPNDIDISSTGAIFVTSDYAIVYADNLNGTGSGIVEQAGLVHDSLAIDRDIYLDIDHDGVIETDILYFADNFSMYYSILAQVNGTIDLPSAPVKLFSPGNGFRLFGMAIDPWTHHLYLVGDDGNDFAVPRIVDYNPLYRDPVNPDNPQGRVEKEVSCGFLGVCTFKDVVVKDDGIYVLNEVNADQLDVPIVLKFDRNLNYVAGFGTISSEFSVGAGGYVIVASTAPGKFYHPKRFFAQENDGLYIIDDSEFYDKVVFINTDLDPASWRTFPTDAAPDEPFNFFEWGP